MTPRLLPLAALLVASLAQATPRDGRSETPPLPNRSRADVVVLDRYGGERGEHSLARVQGIDPRAGEAIEVQVRLDRLFRFDPAWGALPDAPDTWAFLHPERDGALRLPGRLEHLYLWNPDGLAAGLVADNGGLTVERTASWALEQPTDAIPPEFRLVVLAEGERAVLFHGALTDLTLDGQNRTQLTATLGETILAFRPMVAESADKRRVGISLRAVTPIPEGLKVALLTDRDVRSFEIDGAARLSADFDDEAVVLCEREPSMTDSVLDAMDARASDLAGAMACPLPGPLEERSETRWTLVVREPGFWRVITEGITIEPFDRPDSITVEATLGSEIVDGRTFDLSRETPSSVPFALERGFVGFDVEYRAQDLDREEGSPLLSQRRSTSALRVGPPVPMVSPIQVSYGILVRDAFRAPGIAVLVSPVWSPRSVPRWPQEFWKNLVVPVAGLRFGAEEGDVVGLAMGAGLNIAPGLMFNGGIDLGTRHITEPWTLQRGTFIGVGLDPYVLARVIEFRKGGQ